MSSACSDSVSPFSPFRLTHRWSLCCAVLACLYGIRLESAHRYSGPDELRTKSIVIVDAAGRKRADVGVRGASVALQLLDSHGKVKLACVASDEESRLTVGSEDGCHVGLRSGEKGSEAMVGTKDRFVVLRNGSGMLPQLHGQNGKGGAFLLGFRESDTGARDCVLDIECAKSGVVAKTSDSGETSLALLRHGRDRSWLGVHENGTSELHLLDPQGRPRVQALLEESGSIAVKNARGENVVEVGEAADGKTGFVRIPEGHK